MMTNSGQTPGLWKANIARRSDGEVVVAHVVTADTGISICQVMVNPEGDVALLASAPAFLAALHKIMKIGREDFGPAAAARMAEAAELAVMEWGVEQLTATRAAISAATVQAGGE